MSVCFKAESGVVWCGVVWCGVVWCGVVWCGVVLSVLLCGVRLGHCGLGPGSDQVPAMDTAPSKQLVHTCGFKKTFHHIFVQ